MVAATAGSPLELHADLAGNAAGPVVVLVAGLGMHSGMWATVAPRFEGEFHLLLVDNRDTGRSPRADAPYGIEDMADDLALTIRCRLPGRTVGLLGQSMGSAIAIALAARHPALVGACVAVVPPARASRYADVLTSTLHRLSGGLAPADFWSLVLLTALHPDVLDRHPEMVELAAAAAGRDPFPIEAEGHRRQLEAFRKLELGQMLAGVRAPTRIIAGLADRLVPTSHARELAAGIAGAELVVLADAAHGIASELPTVYEDLVAGHFRRHLRANAANPCGRE